MNQLEALITGNPIQGLGENVAKAMEIHLQKKQERWGQKLAEVFVAAENSIQAHVSTVRQYRKMADNAKATLSKINRTVAYLKATGNPFPFYDETNCTHLANQLCNDLEIPIPDSDDPIWKVPKDWNETSTESDS